MSLPSPYIVTVTQHDTTHSFVAPYSYNTLNELLRDCYIQLFIGYDSQRNETLETATERLYQKIMIDLLVHGRMLLSADNIPVDVEIVTELYVKRLKALERNSYNP